MKTQPARLIFFCILLTGLALQGCNLGLSRPVDPSPADLPTLEAVVSTPTLPVLESGTYKEPVFIVTASCPAWGEYVFDLRYSPTDLHIISAGSSAMETGSPCSPFVDGASRCTSIGAPYYLTGKELAFSITYDYGAGWRTYEMMIDNPACPPYEPPAVELESVTCLPGNQVSFLIDVPPVIFWGSSSFIVACLGGEHCDGIGSLNYGPADSSTDPLDWEAYSFSGPAPTSSDLPLRFYYRLRDMPGSADSYMIVFDDFYTRYRAACPAPLPPPQPTATTENPEEESPAACSDYSDVESCNAAPDLVCFWDDIKKVCHP